jgi:hypothetical protein
MMSERLPTKKLRHLCVGDVVYTEEREAYQTLHGQHVTGEITYTHRIGGWFRWRSGNKYEIMYRFMNGPRAGEIGFAYGTGEEDIYVVGD